MITSEWLDTYYKLNNSFKKKLVFRLGVDSGFFSEYNHMILAMVYCLKNNIKFELYSDLTYFAFRDAWDDFFIPFRNKNNYFLNSKINVRKYVIDQSRESSLIKAVKYRGITTAYKFLFDIDYLTQDLWTYHGDHTFYKENFSVPELGLNKATLLETTQQFIRAFWQYNEKSAAIISEFIESANLPNDDYISLHIRAGDKYAEVKLLNFNEYMIPAAQFSKNRRAFVLTDDYSIIEHLKINYPDWNFYTLCQPDERGYFHQEFMKKDKDFKYQQHLKLFANMDICAGSTKFIGTYSSNPGMYMGMRIGEERCHCLDFERWGMI